MQVSIMGMVVCLGILALGHCCRGTLIVGLLASMAFGSTALMTLSSLGGSSPLIYVFFAGLILLSIPVRQRIWWNLGYLFSSVKTAWVLCFLMIYAVIGAWLFPRLFAGQTAVFVQSKMQRGAVIETALAPVSGNISQTAYFVLGSLTAIALCALLLRGDRLTQIRRGFFAWSFLHTGLGIVDLVNKLIGANDLLEPIRTASYRMLTLATEAGFWRIVGSYSEASAFAAASLSCLAFTYTYWRRTGSRLSKYLAATLFGLLLLSTSSTAYVGLAIISISPVLSMARSLAMRRLAFNDVLMLAAASVCMFAVLAISIQNERFFDPVTRLIDAAVLDKASSESGQERTYWNVKSLQAFVDTAGAGVGMGSSRASSWPIAVLSQLGLVGSVLMAALVAVVARGMGGLGRWIDPETNAVVSSVRASALASIVAGSIVKGNADPGMVFFITVAVISAYRVQARHFRKEAALEGSNPIWPLNQRSKSNSLPFDERRRRVTVKLFWLSDEAWAAIEPHLPKNQPGPRRADDRRVISGILHVLKTGCRWKDCPIEYGPPTTIYSRFRRWSRRRLWTDILDVLVARGVLAPTASAYVGGRRKRSGPHAAATPPKLQ